MSATYVAGAGPILGTGGKGDKGDNGLTFNPVGAWSADGTYSAADLVTDGGASYLCTAGVGPSATHPVDDAAHWQLMAAKGDKGDTGAAPAIGNLGTVDCGTGTLDGSGQCTVTPTLPVGGANAYRVVAIGIDTTGGLTIGGATVTSSAGADDAGKSFNWIAAYRSDT